MIAHLPQLLGAPSAHRAFSVVRRRLVEYKRNVASLYAIADVDTCEKLGIDPLELALHWVSFGIHTIQLRAKSLPSGECLRLLHRFVEKLPPDTEVIANDRPDLAELAGCRGVHVGQSDLSVAAVKRTFPTLNVGVSTHDLDQLAQALTQGPSYVAYGPVFATASKRNAEPCVGVEGLRVAYELARKVNVPLVAIGGIDADNIAQVACYCDSIALISAVTTRERSAVEARVAALRAAMAQITRT